MRVLLVPEVYRPDDLSANGTVNDAVSWVGQWLERDDSLHLYWLLPPRDVANYDREDIHADRERVTLAEAVPFMHDTAGERLFTEGGYSEDELRALDRSIFDSDGYLDVVVDQRRTGRTTLRKFLLERADQWAARVRPFDVVANVHDLQLPFKLRYCSYRDRSQFETEAASVAAADGVWFTAGVDRDGFRERAPDFLAEDIVADTVETSLVTGSPIDFDRYDERYADEPRRLHLAGSFWAKKHADRLFALAESLHQRYEIETLVTSMGPIPESYRRPEWVEAHGDADRETYERALRRGDIAICASEYETMARTPFEQAASGQVLLLRDEPWVYDCVPDDYAHVAAVDDLDSLAEAAVERWNDAVAENRRMVDRVRRVRGVDAVGRRTYDDLRGRVRRKRERYEPGEPAAPGPNEIEAVVDRALATVGRDEAGGLPDDSRPERVRLDDLLDRTRSVAPDGRRVTDDPDHALVDVVYALRAMGYRDAGNAGTPVFVRGRWG